METLIRESGGRIEDDIFVVEPGCIILNQTHLTGNAEELFRHLSISQSLTEESKDAVFGARLCYLSYSTTAEEECDRKDLELLGKILKCGHLSVYQNFSVCFLVAGVSDEVVKEFVAHVEAKVSRVTSSNCSKMTKTFYRIWGSRPEVVVTQKEHIQQFLKLRDSYLSSMSYIESSNSSSTNIEERNMFNLGMKASAFTFTMTLKDYHKLFIGRIPKVGNEHDVRLICKRMCHQLHQLYPGIIRDIEFYESSNNNEKYTIN